MELLNLVSEMVKAQAAHSEMTPDDMNDTIKKVYRALKWVQSQEEKSAQAVEEPAVSGLASIQRHKVICLECGNEFRQLSGRHLASHGLDPKAYKRKHEIPLRQSLSARTLSAKRRRTAIERGLADKLAEVRKARKKT